MSDIKMKKKGSKKEVYEGLAEHTAGGLKKDDLCLNKKGQVVSKKRSELGKKQIDNLQKHMCESKHEENENIPADVKLEPGKEEKKVEPDINKPEPSLPAKPAPLPEPLPIEEKKCEEPEPKIRKYKGRKPKDSLPMIDEIKNDKSYA